MTSFNLKLIVRDIFPTNVNNFKNVDLIFNVNMWQRTMAYSLLNMQFTNFYDWGITSKWNLYF